MTERLNIYVRGEPQPQPRPRCRAIKQMGKNGMAYWTGAMYDPIKDDEGKTAPWVFWRRQIEIAVKRTWRGEKLDEPVRVDIDFYFPRPQYLLRPSSPKIAVPMGVKPDCDNLIKLVWDVLKKCGVLYDDGRVCCGEPTKWWVAMGDAPGARIVVSTLGQQQKTLFANKEQ